MNQSELVKHLSDATGTTQRAAADTLAQFSEIVSSALENGEEVTLPGIGKLKVGTRPARTARNPATGAEIAVPEKRVVKFVPAKSLKEAVQ